MEKRGSTFTTQGTSLQKESAMKTPTFLILSLALAVQGSDIKCSPERGINVLRTWVNGMLTSEHRQILSSPTIMYDEYKAWQNGCCDWSNRISQTWFEGEARDGYIPRVRGIQIEHFADGRSETNLTGPDQGTLGSFGSGGDQGAIVVTNLAGERTQIINAATLNVKWETNGTYFYYACPCEDDLATVVLLYRDWNPYREIPYFVGATASVGPGRSQTVGITVPVDCIWRMTGIDKCFGCGESCWLAGWPRPASQKKPTIARTSTSGDSLHLEFDGTPGVAYAVKSSPDMRAWRTETVLSPDGSTHVRFSAPQSAASMFFRIEAVRTATMNEAETALAIKDLKEFMQNTP
jgi:hypothetical protein